MSAFVRSIHLLAGILTAAVLAGASSAANLTIALSNDDGWSAEGIQALKQALVDDGNTVVLAGPKGNQSGSSAVIDLVPPFLPPPAPPLQTLTVTKQNQAPGLFEFSVDSLFDPSNGAEPATSAMIAVGIVREITQGGQPDLVLMGINDGANLGALTQISGTIGGTIHAISSFANGRVPAIAISTDVPEGATEAERSAHFAQVADFTVAFLHHLQEKSGVLHSEDGLLPPGIGLNINYPPLAPEDVQGVKLSVQGRLAVITSLGIPFPVSLQYGCAGACSALPVGGQLAAGIIGADPNLEPDVADSDLTDFQAGYITVVPIEADYTAGQATWAKFHALVNTFGGNE